MAGKDAIRVEGRIVAIGESGGAVPALVGGNVQRRDAAATLPKILFTVELANGHRLLGHVPKRGREAAAKLALGDKVRLEVSPFDLSKGRVIGNGE